MVFAHSLQTLLEYTIQIVGDTTIYTLGTIQRSHDVPETRCSDRICADLCKAKRLRTRTCTVWSWNWRTIDTAIGWELHKKWEKCFHCLRLSKDIQSKENCSTYSTRIPKLEQPHSTWSTFGSCRTEFRPIDEASIPKFPLASPWMLECKLAVCFPVQADPVANKLSSCSAFECWAVDDTVLMQRLNWWLMPESPTIVASVLLKWRHQFETYSGVETKGNRKKAIEDCHWIKLCFKFSNYLRHQWNNGCSQCFHFNSTE